MPPHRSPQMAKAMPRRLWGRILSAGGLRRIRREARLLGPRHKPTWHAGGCVGCGGGPTHWSATLVGYRVGLLRTHREEWIELPAPGNSTGR
jgi:hypothetical protein